MRTTTSRKPIPRRREVDTLARWRDDLRVRKEGVFRACPRATRLTRSHLHTIAPISTRMKLGMYVDSLPTTARVRKGWKRGIEESLAFVD